MPFVRWVTGAQAASEHTSWGWYALAVVVMVVWVVIQVIRTWMR